MRCERGLCAAILYGGYQIQRGLRRFPARSNLANERVFLRRLLRRFPYWAGGHLRLGFVELSLLEISQERVEPRLVAAVDVSAQAALELIPVDATRPRRVAVEATFLKGRVLFVRKNYQEALETFRFCLEAPRSWLLPERTYDAALEYAGAAALALGQREEAGECFKRIAPNRRNPQVQLMVQRLESGENF